MSYDEIRKGRLTPGQILWRENREKGKMQEGLDQKEELRRRKERRNRVSLNGCEVCGRLNGGRKLCWDHDHKTGKFRGWLCGRCNVTLGLAKDDPKLLRKLAAYLERDNSLRVTKDV